MTHVLQTVLSLEKALYERRLRVSTRGLYGFTPGNWSRREHIYYGSDAMSLRPSGVAVVLGRGKGRVVCCALQYDLAQVIGH
jgi:hypothetical protein